MSKNKKDWYDQLELEYPYRLVSPKFSLSASRFKSESEANTAFEYCKKLGHQAILSRVSVVSCSIKIIAYCKAVSPYN